MIKKHAALFAALFASGTAFGSTVAIIDSGVDISHPDFKGRTWTNALERAGDGIDNDRNGLVDDVYGWNFADNNSRVLDESLQELFSPDIYKFMQVLAKYDVGVLTQQESSWVQTRFSDDSFMSLVNTFGGYAHGTHVAGISTRENPMSIIMPIKMMNTDPVAVNVTDEAILGTATPTFEQDRQIRATIDEEASYNAKEYSTWGTYTKLGKADVANCSFGMSASLIMPSIAELLKSILKADPSEATLLNYTNYFMKQVLGASKALVTTAPQTLFVFAAGNDHQDNDKAINVPANIDADNAITVAATAGVGGPLADFSDYGAKTVHVAAPGVAIRSQAPDGQFTYMSGTSQAAPYVTNVAARAKDMNPALTPLQIKQIILSTVDVKAFLRGKVSTSGVVNPMRAYRAAELSKTLELKVALERARSEVVDQTAARPKLDRRSVAGAEEADKVKVVRMPSGIRPPSWINK
jgi:subtilisin family serine protease